MSDISILTGDDFECPDCASECRAIVTYDPNMREYADAWKCDECEAKYYRDVDEGRDWGMFHGVAKLLRGLGRR